MIKVYNDIIGGFENTLLDYSEDEEEYKSAKAFLSNPERIITAVYSETQCEATQRGFAKHIRFAGEQFLKDRIKEKLQKEGYMEKA